MPSSNSARASRDVCKRSSQRPDAQVVRDGQTIECLDSRFSAAVVISAPLFYGEPDLAAVLSSVSVPTIHVTATDDMIEIPGDRSGVKDRLAIFDATAHPHQLLAVFHGGSRSIFANRPFTGGLSLSAKVKVATADLTLAFLDLIFERDGTALAQWQTNWQSILARAPAPTAPRIGMTHASVRPGLSS